MRQTRSVRVILSVVVLIGVAAAPAQAARRIAEYPLPSAHSLPIGIAAGPDGNLWFTDDGLNKIGRITTAGAITEYLVPTACSGPTGIAAGPDGNLWFTEADGKKIGRITTARPEE